MTPEQARSHLAKYGPWAIVTGASSGIGACFAQRLSAGGFNVVLVARREARLRELAKDITAATADAVRTRIVVADLSTDAGVQHALSSTEDLDVGLLVNNAGVEQVGSLWREPADAHRRHVALNCTAPLLLLYGVTNRLLLQRRPGGVINVSSCTAACGSSVLPLYAAGKAFVSTLSVGLHDQLRGAGIDVLACQPGGTESEMIDRGRAHFGGRGHAWDMPAADCVDETLAALGRAALVNTGLVAKAVVLLAALLPRWAFKRFFEDPVKATAEDPALFEPRPYAA